MRNVLALLLACFLAFVACGRPAESPRALCTPESAQAVEMCIQDALADAVDGADEADVARAIVACGQECKAPQSTGGVPSTGGAGGQPGQ